MRSAAAFDACDTSTSGRGITARRSPGAVRPRRSIVRIMSVQSTSRSEAPGRALRHAVGAEQRLQLTEEVDRGTHRVRQLEESRRGAVDETKTHLVLPSVPLQDLGKARDDAR